MNRNPASPEEQAIAEYRAANPQDDDLPDEAIGRLFIVQQRAFGLAVVELGHALGAAWSKRMRRWLGQ